MFAKKISILIFLWFTLMGCAKYSQNNYQRYFNEENKQIAIDRASYEEHQREKDALK